MKSKLLSFAVALLASICLWIYVVSVVNKEVTDTILDIPITFSGEEALQEDLNLVITEGGEATVNLKVTCSRETRLKLSSDNVTLTIDVSRIKKAGEYNMTYTIGYPNGVLNSEVTAKGTPTSISFKVEQFIEKTIPVKGVLNGNVSEGYLAGTMEYDYDEIQIEGPEDLVNQVSYAQVIVEQQNLSESITVACPFTLIDENGEAVESDNIVATVNGESITNIQVTQPVWKQKEIPLVLEFVDGGGATSDDVSWSVEPRTITVAGDSALLDQINKLVVGKYDLTEIDETLTESVPVVVPDELMNVDGIETAQVKVSFTGLSTKTIRITNFEVINVPEGYVEDVKTQQLQVTIRGPVDEISGITAEDIHAIADLTESQLSEGSRTVPVTFQIDGVSQTAALGDDYEIVVSLERE